jgi:hypothetical protein
LRYPVVQHQALVEPLPVGRVEQEFLPLADASGETINRFPAMQDFHYYLARDSHVLSRFFRQANGRALPRNRDDLRNSQVTSIYHDGHWDPVLDNLS